MTIASKTRIALLALAASAIALPAAAASFSAAQKAEIEALIHDYLASHPEDVIAALTNYQKGQQEREAKAFKTGLEKNKDAIIKGPVGGNPNGDVTVVEFYDYNCGYCKKAVSDIVDLMKTDKNVRVILHDLPILSPESTTAAKWALAAGNQGKYFEYHVALMESAAPRGETSYAKIATDLGLDVDKMRKDVAEDKGIEEALERNKQLSQELGIRGTPAFIIGDQLSPGYMGLDNLKKAVEDARKAKKD